jgi:hypothetical protein
MKRGKLAILLTWLTVLQSCAQATLIDDVMHTGGHVDWPDPYIVPAGLYDGARAFCDREYSYSQVPSFLFGADYIVTENEDKRDHTPDAKYTVTVAPNAGSVYAFVWLDNRWVQPDPYGENPPYFPGWPAWLAEEGWADTGEDIAIWEQNGSGLVRYNSVFRKPLFSDENGASFQTGSAEMDYSNHYGIAVSTAAPEPPVWPLVFAADFEDQSLDPWEPTDASAWRIEDAHGGKVLSLFKGSSYSPPYRSPFNINLARDVVVDTFTLEMEVLTTNDFYYHRDLCIFFGYQDAAHFYYVHLGQTADDTANSIFLVDNADRVSIAQYRTDGTDWDNQWHSVRLVRDVKTGGIEVYFDDSSTPVMTAVNHRFRWGRIGVGSFDDTGQFDDIRLNGRIWMAGDFLAPHGVDFADFSHFAAHWLEADCDWPNNNCHGANLTAPNSVGLLDLQLLLSNYLAGY